MDLVIFEKSSQITKVVEALKFQKNGKFYEGTFEGKQYRLVPLAGHILELLPPDVINPDLAWDKLDGLDNIPNDIPMRLVPDKERYLSQVKAALKGVKGIVFGGDPDREGVGLVFEVIEYLDIKLPVSGLWLNQGLDPANVKSAFRNLKPKEFFLPRYYAQQSRSVSDYYWMFLVRVYTYFARNGALSEVLGSGGGRSSVVSVGRVQSTLVALIKEREHLVKTYKPISFFNFEIPIDDAKFTYQHGVKLEDLKHEYPGYIEDREKVYFADQQLASDFRKSLLQHGVLDIEKVEKKDFTENPPDVFSTKDLWAHCTKKLKFGSKKTQTIAESLYREAFLSYPRTKSSHIPKENFSLEFVKGTLDASPDHNTKLYNDVMDSLKDGSYTPPVFRTEKDAHEGIIPTGKPISKLDMNSDVFKEMKKKVGASEAEVLAVYHEIYERFAIACLRKATGFKCKVQASVAVKNLKQQDSSSFSTNSKFYDFLGFLTWHDPNKKVGSADELFIPEEGESVNFESLKLKKGRTSKYEHFNDETLPMAMTTVSKKIDDPLLAKVLEKAEGIGTEATIVAIIDVVLAREYVSLLNSKFVLADKGASLIDVIEPDLCSPHLSAAWELRLGEIENEKDVSKAKEMRDLFLAKQRRFIETKIEIIKEKYGDKLGTFEVVRYSGSGKPSSKQIAFAKKLSKEKGILLSPKTLKSVIETKKWIDKALGKKDEKQPSKEG
tara:strand:- start:12696 stop:14861 length:2166 start_codon:yes stop_codon:yes gene_type:complete